jgi:ectoine hydroxylase-related dioxygenase (phytanoyl-CoA dioxygenase family)
MEAICISNTEEIVKTLKSDGIVKFKNLLTESELSELRRHAFSLLSSEGRDARNPIIADRHAKFISHTMLVENAILAYTNPNVLKIAKNFCGDVVHLSNHRIFQNVTTKGKPQHWHKDNKMDFIENGQHVTKMVSDDMGLIMMYYLEDVVEGGTEFILGSQNSLNDNESFSDAEVRKLGKLYSANGSKAGEGILYDYRMIHRAGPAYTSGHSRLSIFAQMSPPKMPSGEPIAVRTSDIGNLTNDAAYFLNIGTPSTAPNWPSGTNRKIPFLKKVNNKLKSILQ